MYILIVISLFWCPRYSCLFSARMGSLKLLQWPCGYRLVPRRSPLRHGLRRHPIWKWRANHAGQNILPTPNISWMSGSNSEVSHPQPKISHYFGRNGCSSVDYRKEWFNPHLVFAWRRHSRLRFSDVNDAQPTIFVILDSIKSPIFGFPIRPRFAIILVRFLAHFSQFTEFALLTQGEDSINDIPDRATNCTHAHLQQQVRHYLSRQFDLTAHFTALNRIVGLSCHLHLNHTNLPSLHHYLLYLFICSTPHNYLLNLFIIIVLDTSASSIAPSYCT